MELDLKNRAYDISLICPDVHETNFECMEERLSSSNLLILSEESVLSSSDSMAPLSKFPDSIASCKPWNVVRLSISQATSIAAQ
jgi:hypothetical protein